MRARVSKIFEVKFEEEFFEEEHTEE